MHAVSDPPAAPVEAAATEAPGRPGRWAAAWRLAPLRAFALSLAATSLVWGRFLLPTVTLSADAETPAVQPSCRAGTSRLACQTGLAPRHMMDPGAPALQESPANYLFRRARDHGEPRPRWNPYSGSGYPIALDGINAATSPARWFLSHVPGDQGHDVLAFARFLAWTFGLVWALALCGAGTPLLAASALVATLAPYGATFVDIVFLDVDLLAPWFLVVLVAFVTGRWSLRAAALASFAVALVAAAMGFLQSEVAFCASVGLLALAAAPSTRGRSLVLGAAFAAGQLALAPSWLPLVRDLDQFVSSRSVLCIAEQGLGFSPFWQGLVRPPLGDFVLPATATLVGAGMLVFAPRRWWFLVAALAAMEGWIVFGLPAAACRFPLLSAARFWRHLVPHFEMLFIFAVGVSVHALSERLDRKRAWVALAAASAAAVGIFAPLHSDMRLRAVALTAAGVALGIVAAAMRGVPASGGRRRAAFGLALFLLAFTPYLLFAPMTALLLRGRAGAPEIAALPSEIDPATPLGTVQRLAETEDRRHFSPAGFLFPNWSSALGIPDLLLIGPLYPVGYHELNAALFAGWARDPQHGLVPDRFFPPPPSAIATTEFQRVLAVHRVSLLTFRRGASFWSPSPGPYEFSRCRFLTMSRAQGTEAWICPDVGGIGFFPEDVRVVRSRAEALGILRAASPSDIARMALVGPEVDLSGPGPVPTTGVAAGEGRVLSVDRRGDDLTYLLDVDRPGMFAIADTYFRGWHATVNGSPAGISRANVAFKAVRVPAGRVVLSLHFSP